MGNETDFIIGFDILPSHSPHSKSVPKFACVVMRDGIILSEHPEMSKRSLIRLVNEFIPKWLCTDNIFEIVPDSKSIFRFMYRIPSETKLVQVTGVPPHQIALKTLARRHNIPVRGKPSPLEAARIAALLASMGVGHSIECFSAQTEIKVTRGRKMGRGGQSANRYRRKIHSQIQQMTRHIEGELRDASIEYDIDVRTSDFGYSSSRIIAYAPLPVIRELIEAKRGGDFNVLISPVRKRVEFLPLEPKPHPTQIRPRFFVLGIDPGTTAAICLLTLNGKVHMLTSRKGLARADIIRMVYEHGIPVMVATDVPHIPQLVEKIASTINAVIYSPNRPIPVSEKQEVAREFAGRVKVRNAHERDALTAAIYAYRSILPKLRQIDRKIREEQLKIDRTQLKALVIKGTPINEAIASLTHVDSEPVEVSSAKEVADEPLTQEHYDALLKKYEDLREEIQIMNAKLEDQRRLIEFLRFRDSELEESLKIVSRENYWRIKRDREIAKKQTEIMHLQRENKKLRGQLESLERRFELLRGVKRREIRGDMIAIKSIDKFTQECIEEYMRRVSTLKSGDIILFEDASGGGPQTAGLLIERNIRAVIIDTPISHLAREALVAALIPVIQAEDVDLQRIDEFAFISRKKFERQLHKFLKEVREQARQRSEEHLIELIEKYRHETDR